MISVLILDASATSGATTLLGSVTSLGPRMNAIAEPKLFAAIRIDVDVVRCVGGNHVADSTVLTDIAMGPARPLRIWPRWISPVAAAPLTGKQRARAPKKHSPEHARHDHLSLQAFIYYMTIIDE
jgi:hypothetical protein